MKIAIIIGIICITSALYLFKPHWNEFWAVDICLDQGGSYNYTEQECDYNHSNPYRPSYISDAPTFYIAISFYFLGAIFIFSAKKKVI